MKIKFCVPFLGKELVDVDLRVDNPDSRESAEAEKRLDFLKGRRLVLSARWDVD